MRSVVIACLVVALSGCASQHNLVRCDGRLEPINTPVPRTPEADSRDGGSSRPSDTAEAES